jgi:hypothetical protein
MATIATFPVITVDHNFFDGFCLAFGRNGALYLRSGGNGPQPGERAEDIYNAISFLFSDGFPPGSLGPNANPTGNTGSTIDFNAITVIIANGLDAPVKISTVYTKHGDNTGQPTWTHLDPVTGAPTTETNVIPGRGTTIASRKYNIPAAQQENDMETFGIGVMTFTKAAGLWGVGGAIALTSDDPDLKMDPALGFYKGLNDDDFGAVVPSLSQYGGDLTALGDNVANGNPIQILSQTYTDTSVVTGRPGVTSVDVVMQVVMLPQMEVLGAPHPENSVFGISFQKKYS